jgi:hypothetical protein
MMTGLPSDFPEFSGLRLLETLADDESDHVSRIMLDVRAQHGQFSSVFSGLGFDVVAFEASAPSKSAPATAAGS